MEINELRKLPDLIKIKEEETRQELIKKECYELQLEKINMEMANSILNLKNESGKLEFSNEMQRKNALSISQINSNVYCTTKQKINTVVENIEKIKIELRFYHNQIRIEEIIARMHHDN